MKKVSAVGLSLFFTIFIFGSDAVCQLGTVSEKLSTAAYLLQNNHLDDAEKILREIVRTSPSNVDAHNLLGVVLDRNGNAPEAEREYRNAIRLDPKAVSPLANLGVLLARTKRQTEAIRTFELVLRLKPDHQQAIVNLAFLYRSIGQYEKAIPLLQKAIATQPDDYEVIYQLGTMLLQTKKYDEASSYLTHASVISPANADPVYALGSIAFQRGDDEKARDLFNKALELNPNYPPADFMLGELYAKHKNYLEAEKHYAVAVKQDPSQAVYFVRYGGMFILTSRFALAIEIFKNAAARFPKNAPIQYFLALSARGVGDFETAHAAVGRALAIEPNYVDALALSGAVLLDHGDLAGAERPLRLAVAIDSHHYNANYDLGRLLFKSNRSGEAVNFFQTAAKLNADDPNVHYQLFLIYSRLKRKPEADQEFKLFKDLTDKPGKK